LAGDFMIFERRGG